MVSVVALAEGEEGSQIAAEAAALEEEDEEDSVGHLEAEASGSEAALAATGMVVVVGASSGAMTAVLQAGVEAALTRRTLWGSLGRGGAIVARRLSRTRTVEAEAVASEMARAEADTLHAAGRAPETTEEAEATASSKYLEVEAVDRRRHREEAATVTGHLGLEATMTGTAGTAHHQTSGRGIRGFVVPFQDAAKPHLLEHALPMNDLIARGSSGLPCARAHP